VFTPKYHRKIIYGKLRTDIGKILRELCERKNVEIIEAHAMPFKRKTVAIHTLGCGILYSKMISCLSLLRG
jgi:hypothetical protein